MKSTICHSFPLVLVLSGFATWPDTKALAQINPDNTLGAESSVVVPDVSINGLSSDQIGGGALRGELLFHSFGDFNIAEGRGAYFVNPAVVSTIFSRVTGANPSNILGTLGVLGDADLVFLNPNGILFGPNARLDLRGSFTASTASDVELPNGEIFGTLTQEVPSLLILNMDAPIGLIFEGANAQAITNEGILTALADLTLASNNLDLQGQLYAGQDLTLQAQNTVRIQDSEQSPFIAASGDELTVQGDQTIDIFTLNHPDSGLFSGGNMTLRSDNPVNGDAHYWSGGSFQVENLDGSVGDLLSPVDPIIRALGDVTIGFYEGSSLHILAGGSVDIGTAIITAPDSGTVGVDFLQEAIELSDGTIVEVDGGAQPTLDVRAGVTPEAIGIIPLDNPSGLDSTTNISDLEFGDMPTSADITVGDVWINAANGLVLLTNQYEPNTVLEGNISVTGDGFFGDGIDARGFASFGGQGGSVYLDSRDDVAIIDSFIATSGISNAGDIRIAAKGNISIEGNILADARNSDGLGGDIFLISGGTIEVSESSLINNLSGSGGGIKFQANDIYIFEDSRVFAGIGTDLGFLEAQGGNLEFNAQGEILIRNSRVFNGIASDAIGKSGDILFIGDVLSLEGSTQVSASVLDGGQGDAGAVQINISGPVVISDISTLFNTVERRAIGSVKGVTILADSLSLIDGGLLQTFSRGQGLSGNVYIEAEDFVELNGIGPDRVAGGIFTSLTDTGTGGAGEVTIISDNLFIGDGARIQTRSRGQGDSGDVNLNISNLIFMDGLNRSGFSFDNPRDHLTGIFTTVETTTFQEGGDINVQTGSLAVVNGAELTTNTFGLGDSGDITVEAEDTVLLDGFNNGVGFSGLYTTVGRSGQGDAGDINLTTDFLTLTNGGAIASSTLWDGDAGQIFITAREKIFLDGTISNLIPDSFISSGASGLRIGNAGGVDITTKFLSLRNNASISASVSGIGESGRVRISANSIELLNQSSIFTNTDGDERAGDISILVRDRLNLIDSDIVSIARNGATGNAGDILIRNIEHSEGNNLSIELEDGSIISVNNLGQGTGGSIAIYGSSLLLDEESFVAAETNASTGGNIDLTFPGSLVLRNGSGISATAGFSQSRGDGGNITFSGGSIFAVSQENSDITANAFEGNGGIVTINADGIFGLEFRDELTPFSDITASSQLGNPGTVNISTPDIDPNQGLNTLPEEPREIIIADACQTTNSQNTVAFFDIGQGGTPPAPGDLMDNFNVGRWVSLDLLASTPVAADTDSKLNQREDNINTLAFSYTDSLQFAIDCQQN